MARRPEGASVTALTKEVVIAGGGLAGLSLAAGLRGRGVPVVVHEAGHYPRHRVCGEFISGVAPAVLAELGIAECLADAGRPSEVRWFRGGRRVILDELPVAAWAISRHRLDARLAGRVRELGGRVVEGSRRTPGEREGQVWAAGRRPQRGRWIGLKAHYRGVSTDSALEMHLGGSGYVGLCPVEDGRTNVCGLFRLDRSIRGERLLERYLARERLDGLARRLESAEADAGSRAAVAGFKLGWQSAGGCVLGDSAGMIPPFTGNGMSMAFEGARDALDPLEAWSRGECSWSELVAELRRRARRRFRRRLAAAGAMQRILLNPLGQGAIDRLGRAGWLPFRPMLSLVR